jgi:hypothetical protein
MRLLLLSWIAMLLCRWDVVTPPSALSGVAVRSATELDADAP